MISLLVPLPGFTLRFSHITVKMEQMQFELLRREETILDDSVWVICAKLFYEQTRYYGHSQQLTAGSEPLRQRVWARRTNWHETHSHPPAEPCIDDSKRWHSSPTNRMCARAESGELTHGGSRSPQPAVRFRTARGDLRTRGIRTDNARERPRRNHGPRSVCRGVVAAQSHCP